MARAPAAERAGAWPCAGPRRVGHHRERARTAGFRGSGRRFVAARPANRALRAEACGAGQNRRRCATKEAMTRAKAARSETTPDSPEALESFETSLERLHEI